MIDFSNFKSLEEALAKAMQDPRSLKELSELTEDRITELSQLAVQDDWYGDKKLIESSVCKVWKISSIESFIAHSLWCAHRNATRLLIKEKDNESSLGFQFHKPEYLIQTQNKPTVVITPMSLGTHDAINIMLEARRRFDPQRKIIFYGENMESYLELCPEHKELFAEDSIRGTKQILKTLHSGGLFLTYPDFVYKGHQAISGELFGTKRSFSRSFLNLILKCETELLPMTIIKSNEELHMRFYPGIPAYKTAEYKMLPNSFRLELQCLLISKILEGLIVQIPNQWRLLTTLTHQTAEMA